MPPRNAGGGAADAWRRLATPGEEGDTTATCAPWGDAGVQTAASGCAAAAAAGAAPPPAAAADEPADEADRADADAGVWKVRVGVRVAASTAGVSVAGAALPRPPARRPTAPADVAPGDPGGLASDAADETDETG